VEFDSSILSGETPIDGSPALVALMLQGLNLLSESLFIDDATTQDPSPQVAELDLYHVEPTAVFGGVVKLQTPGDAPSSSGREGLVERSSPPDATLQDRLRDTPH